MLKFTALNTLRYSITSKISPCTKVAFYNVLSNSFRYKHIQKPQLFKKGSTNGVEIKGDASLRPSSSEPLPIEKKSRQKAPISSSSEQAKNNVGADASVNKTKETQIISLEKKEEGVPPSSGGSMRRLFTSWQQGVVASIGAVMGIGFLILLFYNPVKEDTVHHTAVVASEALSDVRLRSQAVQLSKGVVENILKDQKTVELVADVVKNLLDREDTKIAVSSLLQSLFEDHYTQEVTKKFVLVIVRDPWIQDQIQIIAKDQVRQLLKDDDIKKTLSALLVDAASNGLENPELHNRAARSIRSWTSTAMSSVVGTSILACLGYLAYELRGR